MCVCKFLLQLTICSTRRCTYANVRVSQCWIVPNQNQLKITRGDKFAVDLSSFHGSGGKNSVGMWM